jgi:ABC-2 type transport system ATP-binding protein
VLAVVSGVLLTGAAPADVRVEEERVTTPGGVELDTSLYLPATTPAPAVLVAHGFGGSKASVDTDARALAARGFVVLTWSARGFGTSTGRIALNSPDHEVADARALVDRLATRPEVRQDGPGDPRVGVPAPRTAGRWR